MTKLGRRRQLLLATAVTASVAGVGTAHAQTSPAGNSTSVQEVVVTAQRRAERLLDVPMSVTAVSAEELTRAGVSDTTDLTRVAPGLTMTFYGNNLQPSIRGVTASGGNVGDNPTIAMYIDGVYQAQQIATLLDLPDVAQVQVLKGPQGTLYGQNATGGAIIITTQSPSFTPTGRFSASYGNYNDVSLRAFVSGPVTDTVAVSLAGGFQDRDGFRRNIVTGQRDKGLDSKVVRGKILFQPSDTAKVTLTSYYSDRLDSNVYAITPLNNNSIGYLIFPNAPKATDPAKQYSTLPGVFNQAKAWGASLTGEFQFDAGTVNLISATASTKVTAVEDLDASPVNFFEYRYNDLKDDTLVNEVNFASRDFGKFNFLVGALYLHAKSRFNVGSFVQRPPNLMPDPPLTPVFFGRSYGVVIKDIVAAYGELTFNVTDQFVLTAGARYTHEKQTSKSDLGNTQPFAIPFPGGPQKWSKFSPRVTARYEITPSSNVYASYSQGFKGGLINTGNYDQDPVDPETIKAYEVGYKGRPLDNLTVTLAGFLYDYKNLQVVAYRGGATGNLYITQNAASTRGKGVDFDMRWAVTPELTLTGAVTYLDAKFRKFPAATIFVPTGFGNTAVAADLSGKRVFRSPKWTGNASVRYETETGAGRVGAVASITYNDGQGLEVSNRVYQRAYLLVDGELSFAPAALDGLRLALWGKNLTNKDYWNMALVTDFSDAVSYAAPRTFGVRAEVQF